MAAPARLLVLALCLLAVLPASRSGSSSGKQQPRGKAKPLGALLLETLGVHEHINATAVLRRLSVVLSKLETVPASGLQEA